MNIGPKLIVTFLAISIIPMLFLGMLSSANSQAALEQATLKKLNILAEGKEAAILEFVAGKRVRVIDFASDGFIRDEVEKLSEIQNLDEKLAKSEALNKHLRQNKEPLDEDIFEIHVFDLDGRIIASSEEDELGDTVDREEPLFRFGLEGTYVQDAHIYNSAEEKSEAMIAVSSPLWNRSNDKVAGVIMNRYSLKRIEEVLSGKRALKLGAPTSLQLEGTTDVFLVNQDNLMVTPSNKMSQFMSLQHRMETKPISECLLNNKEITGTWQDHQGNKVLGSAMCMQIEKDWMWVLVVEQDEEEALAGVSELQNLMVIIQVIIGILVVVIAFFTARSISKPLKTITEIINKISKGNLDTRIPPRLRESKDELGDLAGAFERTKSFAMTQVSVFYPQEECLLLLRSFPFFGVRTEVVV